MPSKKYTFKQKKNKYHKKYTKHNNHNNTHKIIKTFKIKYNNKLLKHKPLTHKKNKRNKQLGKGLTFKKKTLFKNKIIDALKKNWSSIFTSELITYLNNIRINDTIQENNVININNKLLLNAFDIINNELNNITNKYFEHLQDNINFKRFVLHLLFILKDKQSYDEDIPNIIKELRKKYLKKEVKGLTMLSKELILTGVSAAGAELLGAKGPLIF